MRLKELRKQKSLRASDMAAKLGVSQGHYSNLERGRRAFNEELIKKTAKILDVSTTTIRNALGSTTPESHKVGSWLSCIRLNGLPFMKAFQYYIQTNNLQKSIKNDDILKAKIKEFIENNIGFSIVAELSENKSLLDNIKQIIEK